ncbi:hypothetical protein JOB18_031139 [Solea senegalensis]|uniref:Uncharacterized protein n=1 Tax=Solea senegalensis TaxID=28829 RepID=A0AAV6PMX7_SOLSE|nr:hypothetical protein JOB18_031139 [Solea senegalensis]
MHQKEVLNEVLNTVELQRCTSCGCVWPCSALPPAAHIAVHLQIKICGWSATKQWK